MDFLKQDPSVRNYLKKTLYELQCQGLKEHSFKEGSSVLPKILTNFLPDKIFTDLKKGLSGVIKIVDGNERAIPYLIYNLFKKFKIMNKNELLKLEKYCEFKLINHANIVVGNVNTKII